jgi:hypothetical protein
MSRTNKLMSSIQPDKLKALENTPVTASSKILGFWLFWFEPGCKLWRPQKFKAIVCLSLQFPLENTPVTASSKILGFWLFWFEPGCKLWRPQKFLFASK